MVGKTAGLAGGNITRQAHEPLLLLQQQRRQKRVTGQQELARLMGQQSIYQLCAAQGTPHTPQFR
jgi:hypothetical protein